MNNFEKEINEFIEDWDVHRLIEFLKDIIPLCELYNVTIEKDWVKDIVGEETHKDIRLIRTVYLISKIAENHSGKLALIRSKYPRLCQRMEKV
jgi:hypothetical protein